MKPTLGRVVLYRLPAGKMMHPPTHCAAIVSEVLENGSINLHVLMPFVAKPLWLVEKVDEGDLPGQWSWPPRAP